MESNYDDKNYFSEKPSQARGAYLNNLNTEQSESKIINS